jgi:hypothetical protein
MITAIKFTFFNSLQVPLSPLRVGEDSTGQVLRRLVRNGCILTKDAFHAGVDDVTETSSVSHVFVDL